MDIVALGELLIDFTHISTDAQGYPTLGAHPGGAPANFLAAAAKLGCKTALLGKVGEDTFGQLLIHTLEQEGIDTRGIRKDPNVFTTLAFVTLDDMGDRSFSFARKPGADTCLHPWELRLDLLDQAKVFHFGSLSLTQEPSRSATERALAYAKEQGKLISFDPNLRLPLWESPAEAARQIFWGLQQADVVKLSREEGEFLFQTGPEMTARVILEQFPAKLVYVTCGAEGCYGATKKVSSYCPPLEGIRAVDTTGAGDIFGGSAMGILLELGAAPEDLTKKQLETILTYANTAAGLSVETPGGLGSAPTREQVTARLGKI